MDQLTQDQQDRVNVMLHDMATVLDFQGWVKVHAAVMAGAYGFQGDNPADSSQPSRTA